MKQIRTVRANYRVFNRQVLLVETDVREGLFPSQFINSPNRKSLLLV